MADPRTPAAVPDEWPVPDVHPALRLDVRAGLDTDGDTRPDTVLTVEGPELLVHTDLDGDGFADQVLRIGPDATVRVVVAAEPDPVDVDDAVDLWDP